MIPVYKKGERSSPSSDRHIALLSHIRKAIESAIAQVITEKYNFHNTILGFQIGTVTGTAVIWRLTDSRILGITAILDFKSAHDLVSRQKLNEITVQPLPSETQSPISFALKAIEIRTCGEQNKTIGTVARVVNQGSPLSPMLFNFFMHKLPKSLYTT